MLAGLLAGLDERNNQSNHMSVTKSRIQLVKSLERKKVRDDLGLFLSEGPKLTLELLGCFECVYLAATQEFLREHPVAISGEIQEASREELSRMSLLRTPQNVLAVFRKPVSEIRMEEIHHSLVLALDGIQDPGNLGTIMRLADWFGIRDIFCSKETADLFNPKAVQATMGAIARVRAHYVDLESFLQSLPDTFPVYTTELEGENVYEQPLSPHGVIVMGNEGNGVSAQVRRLSSGKLLIPSFPEGSTTSESLNVGIATAIILSEFRRRML